MTSSRSTNGCPFSEGRKTIRGRFDVKSVPGQGSTNAISNDDVEVYGAVGTPTPTGIVFGPNVQIQPAPSNAAASYRSRGMLCSAA